MSEFNEAWPAFVEDRNGNTIYLTWERWDHALGHPGMDETLLHFVLDTLCTGNRKQDTYEPTKYKYMREFPELPVPYTHVVVVVKFGWQGAPPRSNNFVLTAYLIEKW